MERQPKKTLIFAPHRNNNLERWIYVLKNMTTFDRMPFLAQHAVFRKLAEIADISALSKEERDKYDESIRVLRDHISTYEGAVKLGEEKRLRQTIANAKKMGMKMEDIMQLTGLSEEEINKLGN